MRAPRRDGARSKLREWWPELLCAAMLIAIACAGQPADPLFAVFCALTGAIFWIMGHRHRRLPMQATLDGVRQDVTGVREDVGEIRETMHAAMDALAPAGPPEPERRGLRLVP